MCNKMEIFLIQKIFNRLNTQNINYPSCGFYFICGFFSVNFTIMYFTRKEIEKMNNIAGIENNILTIGSLKFFGLFSLNVRLSLKNDCHNSL